jgi:hypothetical protein
MTATPVAATLGKEVVVTLTAVGGTGEYYECSKTSAEQLTAEVYEVSIGIGGLENTSL